MTGRSIDLESSERRSFATHSRQGINIAFIGVSMEGQTACAEYLRRIRGFKRMELREGLIHFLRTSYGYHSHFKMPHNEITPYYDAIYKLNNTLFVNHFKARFENTVRDVVVSDIRYLNELEALKEMGFIIVRVTTSKLGRGPNLKHKLKSAAPNTVTLSMLYDKNFASNYNVEYSVNYTSISSLAALIDPVLEQKGYKLDII